MAAKRTRDRTIFEIMLIVLVLGTTMLLYHMGVYKAVVLNLFYLPIVLSGYFLGRHSAGVLAFFCAICVTVVTALESSGMAVETSPVMTGLMLTVWAAVLGLTALLVGTLCDERAATVAELHEAYVGVVEVVSKYLQGANPRFKTRSVRIAELSQAVAEAMNLSHKEIDDIRVGVLLHDLGDVEVTTKLLGKAINAIETSPATPRKYTFLGTELALSLGSVLTRASSLVIGQDDTVRDCLGTDGHAGTMTLPFGARIIQTVRAYDAITADDVGERKTAPANALNALRKEGSHDVRVLDAIEKLVVRSQAAPAREMAIH